MATRSKLVSGRKVSLTGINAKQVELVNYQFQSLTKLISNALLTFGTFRPEYKEPSELRECLSPLYKFVAEQAAVVFQETFESSMMFQFSVTQVDFVNGVVCVSFAYDHAKSTIRYDLMFKAFLAPWSSVWPGMIEEKGGGKSHRAQWQLV